MTSPLEHYGLIGDSVTVALVSRTGSLDWACLPRVDSDACFAKLLGTDEHGYWSIRPAAEVRSISRRYRPDTLILETEVTCEGGRVRFIDFMPQCAGVEHDIIRIVEGIEGSVPIHVDLRVRFAYGKLIPWIRCDSHRAKLTSGPDALVLAAPVLLRPDYDGARVEADFVVRADERIPFTLVFHPSHLEHPDLDVDAERALASTEAFWREWAGRCRYQGPYRDAVVRSLITLKALTHAPTGGIVAAPTTSLPEELGGSRNWDYRYCWLRDSTLTLDALMLGGYDEEARDWLDWLVRATAGAPAETQIMYGVAGEHRLTEIELPWLPGYEDSGPVRIGNGAYDQFQLDIYGETLNTVYEARVNGIDHAPVDWDRLLVLVDFVEANWQRPDEGIWEIRGASRLHFTHSKLMAWVALDRGVKFIERLAKNAPTKVLRRLYRWRALREEIRADILSRAFNTRIGAFTQSYGSDALDASVLLIPHMGFLPASDPRMVSTVEAIEQGLTQDGFVYRYATETGVDGLPGDEATFLICSFWLVDNLAMAGRIDDATELFERLLSIRNDLGLLAEEYHPKLHRQLGNFPQAFSHVGIVDSAFRLAAKRAGRVRTFPAAMSEVRA